MTKKHQSAYEMPKELYEPRFNKLMRYKEFGLILNGNPFRNIPVILN